jgi:hypothetical protein
MTIKSFSSKDNLNNQSLSGFVEVEYLVIAGGGSGTYAANYAGGGGGAGGYRSSVVGEYSGGLYPAEPKFNCSIGTTYTVTVGAGGTVRNRGNDSVFGPIRSYGGGRGGLCVATVLVGNDGGNGGSGGAGSADGSTYGAGGLCAPGQGFNGGTGGGQTGNNTRAGGGGGAGALGSNTVAGTAPNSFAGAGGTGITSSITGTPVTRAGGGGGGNDNGGLSERGAGGAGGGGAGSYYGTGPVAGTANTGGGGGGGSSSYDSASGGSGVVIIRSPQAAASTSGSPSTSTVDGKYVYVFNGDGSITF